MLVGNFYHVTFNFVKVLSVPRRTNTFNLEIAWNLSIAIWDFNAVSSR